MNKTDFPDSVCFHEISLKQNSPNPKQNKLKKVNPKQNTNIVINAQ